MPKHDLDHLAPTYAAAARFVEVALGTDGSLFTPGRPIWALPTLEELDRLYVQAPDPGSGTFEQKLRVQIADASPDAVQLMAEVLYVYYLPASTDNVNGQTKRTRIGEVLSWAPEPVELPEDLGAVLDHGIGGGGVGFNTYKWASISFLLRFARSWKQLPTSERTSALSDPWVFKAVVERTATEGGGTYGHEALLHLVHPDTFERIFSRSEKWTVAQRFADLVTDKVPDVDRRIAEIRARLAERFGEGFDFYWTIPVMAMWKPTQNLWASFIYWAGRYRDSPEFDATERDYKLALAEALGPIRRAILGGDNAWQELLAQVLRSKDNNLTGWRETDRFVKWAATEPTEALAALSALWTENASPEVAIAGFLERLPSSVVPSPGQRVAIASVLLMAEDPFRHPPYRPTPVQLAYKLTAFGAPETAEVPRYTQAMAFFDAVFDHAATQGVQLRDRLDAQSVTWAIASNDPSPTWPPEDRTAAMRYRASAGAPDEDEVEPPAGPSSERPGRPSLAALADQLLIGEEELGEIADLLDAKHQVVFYGPPGTGKTFVAKKLAVALAGDPDRVRLVQFHPSYAYEDFVEGYRPRLINGSPGFELVPGPLRRMAAAAASAPSQPHFLIIDEMNRGNVTKVLGELYFLLEYREETVELQYSPEPFNLPENLFIIGTMNTADRSIALLDAALRRRFAFVPFFPDREPIAGLLGRWLARNRPEMQWVAAVVDAANAKLADRNGAIGPSFFLQSDLDEARLGVIWKHEIMPYLEDHFFDDPNRLSDFGIERLRQAVSPDASVPPPADDSPEE